MEFPFDISSILPTDKNSICLIHGKKIRHSTLSKINSRHGNGTTPLSAIIDTMGTLSSKAQKLKTIITTYSKFVGTNQRLYIKTEGSKVVGILKIGERDLFYRDQIGDIKELTCACVLDFYVHESCQRKGYGKEMFEKMLEYEGMEACEFAIDRPSGKLLKFLKKYYGLWEFVPQNNNYVIYEQYFTKGRFAGGKKRNKKKVERDYGITEQLRGRYGSRDHQIGRKGLGMKRQSSHRKFKKKKETMRKYDYHRNAANIIGNGYNVPYKKHDDYLSALDQKIKKTENEINLVQDRLKKETGMLPALNQRNVRSLYGDIGSRRGYGELQNSYVTGGMPWATHQNSGSRNRADTSSMRYGSHYFFGRRR